MCNIWIVEPNACICLTKVGVVAFPNAKCFLALNAGRTLGDPMAGQDSVPLFACKLQSLVGGDSLWEANIGVYPDAQKRIPYALGGFANEKASG